MKIRQLFHDYFGNKVSKSQFDNNLCPNCGFFLASFYVKQLAPVSAASIFSYFMFTFTFTFTFSHLADAFIQLVNKCHNLNLTTICA